MDLSVYKLSYDVIMQENPEKKPNENPDKHIPNKQPERHIPEIPYKNPDPTKPVPDDNPDKGQPIPIKEPDKNNPAILIWF